MIKNQEAFKQYCLAKSTEGTCNSYLTYLRNAARALDYDIVSEENFYPEEDVLLNLSSLLQDNKISDKEFNDWRSAIRRYVTFLQENTNLLPKVNVEIRQAWEAYIPAFKTLSNLLEGESNIVGNIAERLCAQYFDATLLPKSSPTSDMKDKNDLLYQVKARMVLPSKLRGTALSAFRKSTDSKFDYHFLCVVLFDKNDGSIMKVLLYEADNGQLESFMRNNSYQNAGIITFSKKFEDAGKDITEDFKRKVNWY